MVAILILVCFHSCCYQNGGVINKINVLLVNNGKEQPVAGRWNAVTLDDKNDFERDTANHVQARELSVLVNAFLKPSELWVLRRLESGQRYSVVSDFVIVVDYIVDSYINSLIDNIYRYYT